MSFDYFITGFFDEEEKKQIDTVYYTTPKKYCFKKVYIDGNLEKIKRVSEKEYISSYESHMNY